MPVEKAVFNHAHKEVRAIISLEDLTKTKTGGNSLEEIGNLCPQDAFNRQYRMANLLAALRRNSAGLATVKSRLWKSAQRSNVLDYKRSMARNILYGGDILQLHYQKHKQKKIKMVVICDVSASMLRHMKFVLPLFFGLSALKGRHETFVFANQLERVTHIFGSSVDIAQAIDSFLNQTSQVGHGTDITRSIEELKTRFPGLLSSTTLFVLISDGETLNPTTAGEALRDVSRRVRRILWLNTQNRNLLQKNPFMRVYKKYCCIEQCQDLQQLVKVLRKAKKYL